MLCCAVLCCAVLCCAVLCCAVLCCAVLCCAVLCCAVLCCAVLCCAVLCCAVLCCAVLCCAVLCCAVLCCAVLCCAVLCCAVLCCAVLCCAVLCCAVLCCTGRQRHSSELRFCGSNTHQRCPRHPWLHCTLINALPCCGRNHFIPFTAWCANTASPSLEQTLKAAAEEKYCIEGEITGDQIADTVAFLVSDLSRSITGQVIYGKGLVAKTSACSAVH